MEVRSGPKEVESVITYKLKLKRRCLCDVRDGEHDDWHPLSDHIYSECSWVIDTLPLLIGAVSEPSTCKISPNSKLSLPGINPKIFKEKTICTDPLCKHGNDCGRYVGHDIMEKTDMISDHNSSGEQTFSARFRNSSALRRKRGTSRNQAEINKQGQAHKNDKLFKVAGEQEIQGVDKCEVRQYKCSIAYCTFSSRIHELLKRHELCHKKQNEKHKFKMKCLNTPRSSMLVKDHWYAKTRPDQTTSIMSKTKVGSEMKSYSAPELMHQRIRSREYQCTVRCNQCHKQYSHRFRRLAVMHVKLQEKGASLHCTNCVKITAAAVEIEEVFCEQNEKDALPKPSLGCDRCLELKFSTVHDYARHVKMHNQHPHECTICALSFRNKNKLDRHIISIHAPPNLCDICGKYYRNHSHFTIHEPEELSPCVCSECGKSFARYKYLKTHIKAVHTDPSVKRSLSCNICGKVFHAHSSLYGHRERHRIGKVPCQVCPKVFSCPKNLKSHMLTHLGGRRERLYCPECNKAFKTPQGLKIHQKNAHSQPDTRPHFYCEQCGKKFISKNGYQIHCKNHGR